MLKIPSNIIELNELEQRWLDAQFFVSQSDDENQIKRAEDFIKEAEEAFSKCTVRFVYGKGI